jgi:DNA-binding NtrC family response regulator
LRSRLQKLVFELVDGGIRLEQAEREFEKEFILAVLEKNRGNLSLSARSLGIHRNTLNHKIRGLRLKEWLPKRNGSRPAFKSS